jgi:hypothetical protein
MGTNKPPPSAAGAGSTIGPEPKSSTVSMASGMLTQEEHLKFDSSKEPFSSSHWVALLFLAALFLIAWGLLITMPMADTTRLQFPKDIEDLKELR